MNWIDKIKNDENGALSDIYMLFKKECITWLGNQYKLNPEDSIEVFQCSVIILYDNVISGKLTTLSSNIKTYLFAIAKNQALVLLRKNKREQDVSNLLANFVIEETDHFLLESDLLIADLSLELIGEPCKSLLQLYYYKNLNMEEITHLLGYKNADTTKNQKYKCLKRLQTAFWSYKNKKD